MKRLIVLVAVLLLLAACSQAAPESPAEQLRLVDRETVMLYTGTDLEALAATQAAFRDVTYVGVPLAGLLVDAGIDAGAVRAVTATASDGFSASYDPALFLAPDTLVAYATADGPLSADDGTFRMVLPAQEGKMNVRQLVELTVVR